MRKLMILLVAFLLPLSALEMSADEKEKVVKIPSPWESEDILYPYYNQILARFIIKVEPKNGAPVTYIYKTFDLDYDVDHDVFYH